MPDDLRQVNEDVKVRVSYVNGTKSEPEVPAGGGALTSVRGRKSGSAWTLAMISHRMMPKENTSV